MILLTPGPVPVPKRVLLRLSEPIEHHRTPGFLKAFAKVLVDLKAVFQTDNDCYILTSTGSGAMEAVIANLVSPGETVGVVVSGKFGERWAEMARVYGADVVEFVIPKGESVRLPEFNQWLAQINPSLILSQVCETSTGALHPVDAMAKDIRKQHPDCLFAIDAITALGALPLPMDQWGFDAVVGGSQKAFMLPTGLSFLSLSARAWKRAESATSPRYYFDLRKERDANKKGESAFSTAVPLIKALESVLTEFNAVGIFKIQSRIATVAQAFREAMLLLELQEFPKIMGGISSPSLTAVKAPEDCDSQKWRQVLEDEHQVIVMGGQDDLKGKILRVGHMGDISDEDVLKSIKAIAKSLCRCSPTFAEKFTDAALEQALNVAEHVLKETSAIDWTSK